MPAVPRAVVTLWVFFSILVPTAGSLVAAQETPEPRRYGQRDGYAGQFSEVFSELNAFWLTSFQAAGITYRTPNVISLEEQVVTGCGPAGPVDFAFYCPRDETIYYAPDGLAAHHLRLGDFAPVVVMSHEWGHHVQGLVGLTPAPGNAFELQADCLAGAYASHAEQQGLLDPGDVTEAVASSADAGDPLGLPQDRPGAHGNSDDRVIAFMRGFLDGVSGCNLPLTTDTGTVVETRQDESKVELWPLLPLTLDLPQGQPFVVESEGVSTFEDMSASLPHLADAPLRLRDWGWDENVYRIYSSDTPPPGAADWVAIGTHRFATVDGAAAALPVFAEARRRALGFEPVDVGLFSDQTEAMAGPVANGEELIIYARRGNLVFRVDGIAPHGEPTADVFEALLTPLRELVDEPRLVSPALFATLPDVEDRLPGLDLVEVHGRSGGTIAATFPNVPEAERLFQAWGWRENAARVYVGSTASGTTRVEVSVFRFGGERDADEALSYFLEGRAQSLGLAETAAPPARADEAQAIAGPVQGGHESTVYIRRGRDLFRITAIGTNTSLNDVAVLLT